MKHSDTNTEAVALTVDALRALIKVDAIGQLEPEAVYRLIVHLQGQFPQSMTDFVGMTGGGRVPVKGLFTRTTYTDRIENESEHGYRATADRIMRNVIRNFDESV